MPTNVAGLSVLGAIRMDPSSLTQFQRDLIEGLIKATEAAGPIADRLGSLYVAAIQKSAPGAAVLRELESAFKQAANGKATEALERKIAGLAEKFKNLGDVSGVSGSTWSAWASGLAGQIQQSRQGTSGPSPTYHDTWARQQFDEEDKQRNEAIKIRLAAEKDMLLGAAKFREIMELQSKNFNLLNRAGGESSGLAGLHEQADSIQERHNRRYKDVQDILSSRDDQGNSFYKTNRSEYFHLKRINAHASMFDAHGDQLDAENEHNKLVEHYSQVELENRTKAAEAYVARARKHAERFTSQEDDHNHLADQYSQVELARRTKEAKEKVARADTHAYNDPAHPEAAQRRQDLMADLTQKYGEIELKRRIASAKARVARADTHAYSDPANPDRIAEAEAGHQLLTGGMTHKDDRRKGMRPRREDLEHTLKTKDQRKRSKKNLPSQLYHALHAQSYAKLTGNLQREQDKRLKRADAAVKAKRAGKWAPGHNFRFASQNVGFGIDDAIQSYHYGGVGASVRAASNNVTAIAGMTIPNPVAAAAAVVGLSVFTAALPTILKKMGLDEKVAVMHTQTAESAYTRTGASSGAISRRTATAASYSNQIDKVFAAEDQMVANAAMRKEAYDLINSGGHGFTFEEKDLAPGWFSSNKQRRLRKFHDTTPEGAAKFDAAMKFLEDEQRDRPLKNQLANNELKHSEFLKANLPAIIATQAIEAKAGRQHGYNLGNADSLKDYNTEIQSDFLRKSALINANPAMSKRQRILAINRLDLEAIEARSDTDANQETVDNNVRKRKYRIEDAEVDGLPGTQIGAVSRKFDRLEASYRTDRSLSPKDLQVLLANNNRGKEQSVDRAAEDLRRESLFFTSPIAALSLQFQRRKEDISNDRALTDEQRTTALDNNQVGFKGERKRIMDAMMLEDKVTNPLGALQDSFITRSEALKKKFEEKGISIDDQRAMTSQQLKELQAEGGITNAEQEQLTLQLKQNYVKSAREANTPSGHEKFIAEAMGVGSRSDRELEFKSLNNFQRPKAEEDAILQLQKLQDIIDALKPLADINKNLEVARLGI